MAASFRSKRSESVNFGIRNLGHHFGCMTMLRTWAVIFGNSIRCKQENCLQNLERTSPNSLELISCHFFESEDSGWLVYGAFALRKEESISVQQTNIHFDSRWRRGKRASQRFLDQTERCANSLRRMHEAS